MTLKTTYSFRDDAVLLQALTHKSYHNEHPENSSGHNERLEFLGDAVLDLALSDLLMRIYPEFNEGVLSKVRASLVNESELAELAVELNIHENLRLGRGELQTGGANKPRLLASAFEAFIGAMYLDSNFDGVLEWVNQTFKSRVDDIDEKNHYSTDYKTRLQEKIQEKFKTAPKYIVVNEDGPDHNKTFFVEVRLKDKTLAHGQGKSKKQAEQQAAKHALEVI